MCLPTWCKIIAATCKAGEDTFLDVTRASLANIAIILLLTSCAVGQLIDTAALHTTVAVQLEVALIDRLRVHGRGAILRLGLVLCGNAGVSIAALDAGAQDTGVGAFIASVCVATK